MCLAVKKIKHSYKLETVDGEQLIPVWKVVQKCDGEKLVSPFISSYQWKKGWNKSNRKTTKRFIIKTSNLASSASSTISFTLDEQLYVNRGFHFCLTKANACELMNSLYKSAFFIKTSSSHTKTKLVVVKMYARKKDVVAKGRFGIQRSLVTTQAYWKG